MSKPGPKRLGKKRLPKIRNGIPTIKGTIACQVLDARGESRDAKFDAAKRLRRYPSRACGKDFEDFVGILRK